MTELKVRVSHLEEDTTFDTNDFIDSQINPSSTSNINITEETSILNPKDFPPPKKTLHNIIAPVTFQKWYVPIKIIIKNEIVVESIALVDSSADLNCIRKGLVPTKYFEKTTQSLNTADGSKLQINYKLTDTKICNQGICIESEFLQVKNLKQLVILGTPFLTMISPFNVDTNCIRTKILDQDIIFELTYTPQDYEINLLKENLLYKQKQICYLQEEIKYDRIEEQLKFPKIKQQIENIQKLFEQQICSEIPNAFRHRKQHIVDLSYEKGFHEKDIPTKARSSQMDMKKLEYCKKEINELLQKKLIRPSKSSTLR